MTVKLMAAALAGSACLLATTSVFATDAKDQGASASFASLDRNGDQRISRSEAGFDRKLSVTFAELDTDGDGFVSAAEFAAGEKSSTAVGKLTPR